MKKIFTILFAILMIIISLICKFSFSDAKVTHKYEQHKQALKTDNSGSISDNSLVTHLPIISIETHNQKIPGSSIFDEIGKNIGYEKGDNGEEEIVVDIKIFDNEEAKNNIENKAEIESKALFNIRGNSSRAFSKKSYKITFVDDSNLPKSEAVMGMEKAEEWVLYAPFLDKTLLRNYMWHNISGNIFKYSSDVRFCECYVDGKYQGLFVMIEPVDRGDGRVEVEAYDKNSRLNSYILKLDKARENSREISTFSSYTSHLEHETIFSILYPGRKNLNDNIKGEIEKEISSFEKALYSYDFKDPKKGYLAYIDLDSWVDFYIIQEFLANNDMCSRSTYLYKERGRKLSMGPLWDFNNVCDNYISTEFPTEGFMFAEGRIWYEMLLKDEKFVKKVQKRYKELRKTYLSEEYLMNYIDECVTYLGDAINRNFEVWGYTFERENQTSSFEYLKPIERNPENYEEAISQYKEFLVNRGKWMDENIDNLLQYSHTSKNKLFLE